MPDDNHPPFPVALFMMTVMSPSCWFLIGALIARFVVPSNLRSHPILAILVAIVLAGYTVYNLFAVGKYVFSTFPPPFVEISVHDWRAVHRTLFTADLIVSTLLRAATIDLLVGF